MRALKKNSVTLSGFWQLKGWGGFSSESVKKGKFLTKIFQFFFEVIMLNEVLVKICENDTY